MPLISLIVFFSFLAFSGFSLGWTKEIYDEWRLIQCIIFVLTIFSLFFYKKYVNTKTTLIALGLLFLMGICITFSPYPQRTLADGSIYLLLCCLGLASTSIFKQNKKLTDIFFLILALLPLLTALWLPIDIVISTLNKLPPTDAWHTAFINIRYYNDALLPCFFLLWSKPVFLRKYPSLILAISIIYLWGIWTDGARAVILGIFIGLIGATILQKENKRQLKIPLLSLLFSYLLYQSSKVFNYPINDITRSSSSGRMEIWSQYFSHYLEHPLLGIGANNTEGILYLNGLMVMHPHNIVLQWLTEWGMAGLLAILLLILLGLKFIKYRHYLPFFALAGSIAVTINALLSGSMVYPLSQVLSVVILAWGISYFPKSPTNNKKIYFWQKTYLYALFFFALLISVHYQDVFQYQGSSEQEKFKMAPRFWQYGQSDHLNHPTDTIK